MRQEIAKNLIRSEYIKWLNLNNEKADGRSENRFIFFGWLQKNKPDLLEFRCKGDKWQTVNVMLSGLAK